MVQQCYPSDEIAMALNAGLDPQMPNAEGISPLQSAESLEAVGVFEEPKIYDNLLNIDKVFLLPVR